MKEDSGTVTGQGIRVQRLWLNTLENCRKSLGRLIREFHRMPEPDVQQFRALVYAFAVMLNYYKTEEEMAIVERIAALERSDGSKSHIH